MKKDQIAKTKKAVPVQREKRYFTVEARKAIVEEIDAGLSKAEAARRYETSQATIYNWVRAHSRHYTAPLVKVVEHKSQADKTLRLQKELEEAHILNGKLSAALAMALGIIEKADEELGTDLKKNLGTKYSWVSTAAKSPVA